MWQTPLEPLRLQAGLTYADVELEELGAARAFFSAARRNDRPSFAPEWSGTVAATFEQPVGGRLLFRANVGAKYTSEYNTGSNLDPLKIQNAFTLVNARLGIGSRDSRWMIELWSQNLTDEDYFQVAFDATLQSGTIGAFPGAPRTWGATARFSF